MTFTTLQYYVDTLRLLNRDDISLNEKFQALSDCLGEDRMLQMLKNVAKSVSKDKTKISSLHDTFEDQMRKKTGTEMHCLNFPRDANKSTFTGRTLSMKSILCHILSMVDVKSHSKCCCVNRQWFHDSFDCLVGNVLDLGAIQDLPKKVLDHCRTHDENEDDYDDDFRNEHKKMIRKYFDRFTKCKTIRSNGYPNLDIYYVLLENWESFSQLESIDIYMAGTDYFLGVPLFGHPLCSKLLNNIGSKSDNIRKLKLKHDAHEIWTHDGTSSKWVTCGEHASVNDCNGFGKLEILQLTDIIPYVMNENPKFDFVFGLVLKEVILDINEKHVGIFKKCLKYYENAEMKFLNVFELVVRTGKERVAKNNGNGHMDSHLFDSKDLLRLAQFILNVSKLKIHCPFINKFKLLALLVQKAQFEPNLIELDIRLELVDNIPQTKVQMKEKRMNARIKDDIGINGAVDDVDNVDVDVDDENESDNSNNSDNSSADDGGSDNNSNSNKSKINEKGTNTGSFKRVSIDNDADEMSALDNCGFYDDDGNNSKKNNIDSDSGGSSSDDSSSDASSSDAVAQLLFAGEETTFGDVDLSMVELKNVKILIDKDWYCFYLGSMERIGEILHFAECIDIQIGGDNDKNQSEYRKYCDSLVNEAKCRCWHTILSKILHQYISINTRCCNCDNNANDDDLTSKKLISSKVQCIRASVECSQDSGSIEEIIQLLNDFAKIDEMRKHEINNQVNNENENANEMVLFVDLNFYIKKRMKFSQLCNDVPKMMKLLKHLIENCLVNIDIHVNGDTPHDIFDCYKDEFLKGLNNMKNKNSKLLSQIDDNYNFDCFKYYKIENDVTMTFDIDDSRLRLINATKVHE